MAILRCVTLLQVVQLTLLALDQLHLKACNLRRRRQTPRPPTRTSSGVPTEMSLWPSATRIFAMKPSSCGISSAETEALMSTERCWTDAEQRGKRMLR